MKIANLCLLLIVLLTSFHCTKPNDPEIPPEEKTNLAIEVEDVSCTEAWINLKIDKPNEVKLFIDDKETNPFHLTSDTLIYLDTLLPNKSYKIEAAYLKDGILSEKISALVQTMDITSHNYTWETFEFGDHGNSVIRDISILDENNIWAVGEIYTNDSLNYNFDEPYSIARWNGSGWKLNKIFIGTNTAINYNRDIEIIDSNNIYIAAGSLLKWDGKSSKAQIIVSRLALHHSNASIEKILCLSPSSIYGIGYEGTIVHYNGSSWQRIESGTNIPLLDIAANGDEIWINGYSYLTGESILLNLKDNKVTKVWEQNTATEKEPYGIYISSIFITNKDMFVDSDYGVFRNKLGVDSSSKWIKSTFRYDYKITGTASNDVYTVGDQGDTWHYNGLNWKQIYIDWSRNSRLRCAAAKDNLLVSGGDKYVNPVFYKALIKIGKRQ